MPLGDFMRRPSLLILVLGCVVGALMACSSQNEHTEPAPSHTEKLQAPIEVSLKSSGRRGRVTVTLHGKALQDIPEVVGKFALPKNVALVDGKTEVSLGALKTGETVDLKVVLDVPPKQYQEVAAGFDLRFGEVQVHKGDVVELGSPRGKTSRAPTQTFPDGRKGRITKVKSK